MTALFPCIYVKDRIFISSLKHREYSCRVMFQILLVKCSLQRIAAEGKGDVDYDDEGDDDNDDDND